MYFALKALRDIGFKFMYIFYILRGTNISYLHVKAVMPTVSSNRWTKLNRLCSML